MYMYQFLILVYNRQLNTSFHSRHFYTGIDTHAMLENFLKTLTKTDSRQLFLVGTFISKRTKIKHDIYLFYDDNIYRFKSQNLEFLIILVLVSLLCCLQINFRRPFQGSSGEHTFRLHQRKLYRCTYTIETCNYLKSFFSLFLKTKQNIF